MGMQNINNVEGAKQAYLEMTENGGQVKGYNEVALEYEDGVLTFTEDDGDVFAIEVADLSTAEIDQLTKDLNLKAGDQVELNNAKADAVDGENAVDGVDEAGEVVEAGGVGTLEENQAKLKDLQNQWNFLDSQAEELKEKIETISEEIKVEINKMLEEAEKVEKIEKERVQDGVADAIAKFKKDKEDGKEVSLDTLQGDIQDVCLGGNFSSKMAAVFSQKIVTDTKMVQMDSLLNQLGNFNSSMKALDGQISDLKDTVDKQKLEEAAKSVASSSTSCDPIGFQAADGTKYEFVIDKNNDGELSSFSEFLGAEDKFAAMQALDTDGIEGISEEELKAGGVKVLVTNEKTGMQELMSIDDAFGKDADISIGAALDQSKAGDMGNGQELLGNFEVNIEGGALAGKYEGYSTDDSEEYLKDHYKFTTFGEETVEANDLKAPAAADVEAPEADPEQAELKDGDALKRQQTAEELDAFLEVQTEALQLHQENMALVEKIIGLDKEIIDNIKKSSQDLGEYLGQEIIDEAEKNAKAKQEKEAAENEPVEEEPAEAPAEAEEPADGEGDPVDPEDLEELEEHEI